MTMLGRDNLSFVICHLQPPPHQTPSHAALAIGYWLSAIRSEPKASLRYPTVALRLPLGMVLAWSIVF
jgi:hypothetical protein